MWYLNETNTDEITVAEVRAGDIITMGTRPEHGRKVHIARSDYRNASRRMIMGSGWTWRPEWDVKVLRLRSNPDGTAMRATNR